MIKVFQSLNDFFIDCKIIAGGDGAANKLADKHDMVNMGEIIPESGYYLLRSVDTSMLHDDYLMMYCVTELMKTVGGEEV